MYRSTEHIKITMSVWKDLWVVFMSFTPFNASLCCYGFHMLGIKHLYFENSNSLWHNVITVLPISYYVAECSYVS